MAEQKISQLTEILTFSVVDTYNENIGTIKDIYFDVKHHQILYLVVSVGGFSVVGNKEYRAVPWSMFHYNPVTKVMRLTVPKDKIYQSPAIRNENPHKPDEKIFAEIFQYYGQPDQRGKQHASEDNFSYDDKSGNLHQAYEGSAKMTEDVPNVNTEEEVNYDKIKGIENK